MIHPAQKLRSRCRRGLGRRAWRARLGVTLMELSVAVIIAGVLVAFIVPSFTRVTEQNKVDAASQYLRSVWSAQRMYWLENHTFTDQLGDLNALGLLDPKIAAGDDGYYLYEITSATASTFSVTAQRHGSTVWSGTLTINQDGTLGGSITGTGGKVLSPPDL